VNSRRLLGALAAALLLAGVSAVILTRPGDEPKIEIVAGSSDVGPVPEETTTTTVATPTTTAPPATPTTKPSAAPTTTTRARPTTTTTQPGSSLGPAAPGTVTIPYQAGRSSWEAVSNGITMRVRIEPAAPRAGEPVKFLLEASAGPDQTCCGVYLLYGDGGSSSWKMEWPAGSCDTARPGTVATDYTHTYNKDGRWEFSFQAVTGNCGTGNVYGSIRTFLQVGPGTARSQGPSLPRVKITRAAAPGDPANPLRLFAEGEDTDGYIARFVIDWGDGSPFETRPGDPMGCRPTRSGWPAAA
jgi:hypothetical protein